MRSGDQKRSAALSKCGATEPFTEEVPQEVDDDTYETREER